METDQQHQPLRSEQRSSRNTHPRQSGINEAVLNEMIARQLQNALEPVLRRVEEMNLRNTSSVATPAPTQANPVASVEIQGSSNMLNGRKRRKFPSWDGERRTFNSFIREVLECIDIDRDLMGTDRAVWFDINASLPPTAKLKVSVFNSSGPQINWDYKQFINHLKRTFGNRQEKEDRQEELARLKQRENQRFTDFFPKFDEVLTGAGGESWTEESKVVWLRRSLSESLKVQLIQVSLDPSDYYGFVKQIEEVAYRYEHTYLFKGSKNNTRNQNPSFVETSTPSEPNYDNDGDVIMSPVASKNGVSKGLQSKVGTGQAKWVDETEIQRRRQSGLCLRCGANRHFIAQCPYRPPKRPRSDINNVEIDIPPQLDLFPTAISDFQHQGKE